MRLLCFGDSNTYGYDPRSYLGERYSPEHRWVDLLAEKTGWEIQNGGQNGREIPHRPQERMQAKRLLDLSAPLDGIVVMLGDNDLLQGASIEMVLSRMEAFLNQISPLCGNLLLVAPPPMQRGTWVTEDRLLTDSIRLAEQYQVLARRLGIGFADAGTWDVELTFDGVHFSEAGHRAFAEGICAALQPGRIRETDTRPPDLLAQLTAVWEASVRTTHHFLAESDMQELRASVPQALASVAHLAVMEQWGRPVGFLGTKGTRLEMLFLSPASMGRGLGRQLLTWGVRQYGIREVCVNEQNPGAVGFYEHLGFRPYKRTELDEQGRPFPLLYLRQKEGACSLD